MENKTLKSHNQNSFYNKYFLRNKWTNGELPKSQIKMVCTAASLCSGLLASAVVI